MFELLDGSHQAAIRSNISAIVNPFACLCFSFSASPAKMREATFPQMMRGRVDVKKLKFSTTELRSLALQTHCKRRRMNKTRNNKRMNNGTP